MARISGQVASKSVVTNSVFVLSVEVECAVRTDMPVTDADLLIHHRFQQNAGETKDYLPAELLIQLSFNPIVRLHTSEQELKFNQENSKSTPIMMMDGKAQYVLKLQ